jgi:hypothetical protein
MFSGGWTAASGALNSSAETRTAARFRPVSPCLRVRLECDFSPFLREIYFYMQLIIWKKLPAHG